jgi:hypothetical protein
MRRWVASFLLLVSGCVSYQPCHRSHLIDLRNAVGSDSETRRILRRQAPWFEDAIVCMADDFQVPLHRVIPVMVYHDGVGSGGRSYYNRLTRSIVLRGKVERATFVHELSHLLAHQVNSSPPYWSDQALAEYMETRFDGGPGVRLLDRSRREPPPLSSGRGEKEKYLLCCMAQAREPSEVLAHLSRDAVDEERGWGLMVVRYLFDDRWRSRPLPEKIRLLLRLREEEVAEIAPEVLEYCRRRDLLGGTSAAGD